MLDGCILFAHKWDGEIQHDSATWLNWLFSILKSVSLFFKMYLLLNQSRKSFDPQHLNFILIKIQKFSIWFQYFTFIWRLSINCVSFW